MTNGFYISLKSKSNALPKHNYIIAYKYIYHYFNAYWILFMVYTDDVVI